MVAAITTVHRNKSFETGDNGFEIHLYYIVILITLLIY